MKEIITSLPFSVVEVAPRDGLQNERVSFSTCNKIDLVKRLIDAGLKRIEVASFVHPARVPEMADAEKLLAGLPDRTDVSYIGLVLNRHGVERALKTKVDEISCVVVATDSFGQRNQGQTIADGILAVNEILKLARRGGRTGQVTISAAFGCPYEGDVAASRVIDIAQRVAEAEPREIALADTIGAAVPGQVRDLFAAIAEKIPDIPLRGHFHNTRNTGIANAFAALENGARALDASLGGIGGCPFAPKATGNIATEDLVYLLHHSGVQTGVSLPKLINNTEWIENILGRTVPSLLSKAGDFPEPP